MGELSTERKLMREKIQELEKHIYAAPQIELETLHHFSKGVYVRELRIPAGIILTGKIHRHETVNILAKGKILIATEEGTKEMEAPQIFVSPPGTKKAGLALEDTVWLNVHPTNERDLEKIEEEFIVNDFEQLEQQTERLEV